MDVKDPHSTSLNETADQGSAEVRRSATIDSTDALIGLPSLRHDSSPHQVIPTRAAAASFTENLLRRDGAQSARGLTPNKSPDKSYISKLSAE